MKQTKMSKQERMVEGAMTAAERAQKKLDEEIKRLAALDETTEQMRKDLGALAEGQKAIDAAEAKAIALVHAADVSAVEAIDKRIAEKLAPFEEQLAKINEAKVTVEASIATFKREQNTLVEAIDTAGGEAIKEITKTADEWRAKAVEVTKETERQLLALATARKPTDEALALHRAALGTLKDATARLASLASAAGLTSTTPVEPTGKPVVNPVVVEPPAVEPSVVEPPPRRLLTCLELLGATRSLPAEFVKAELLVSNPLVPPPELHAKPQTSDVDPQATKAE